MIDATALTGRNNYFEDFHPGDVFEHARGKTIEVTENVVLTNLVLNTAQLHFNEHFAESQPQKHRVTFGGVTASMVIGLAMQDTGENAVEEIGLDKVRFRVPVLHGDTLYAFTEVLTTEPEPDDTRGYREVGLVHFRHYGVNQRGETVFEGDRRVLIKKRAFTTAGIEFDAEPAETSASARRVVKRADAAASKARSAKSGNQRKSGPQRKLVRQTKTARQMKTPRPTVKSAKTKVAKPQARRPR